QEIEKKIKIGIFEIQETYNVNETPIILELRADLASKVGMLYSDLEDFSEAQRYFQLALVGYGQLELTQKVAAIKGTLGALYLNNGDHLMALKFYEDAYEFWKNTNFLNERIVCLQNLGLIHLKLEDSIKASDFIFEAMKKSISLQDETQFAISIDILLRYYEEKDRYDMLLELKKKALEFWRSLDITERIFKTLIDIGVISQILNENKVALSNFKNAFNLAYSLNQLEQMFLAQGFIAEVYVKLKDIEKAKHTYMQAYKLAVFINTNSDFKQHMIEMEISLLTLGVDREVLEIEAQKVLKES
ncbi:MAG: tetratricopeptide repeat protein, partial [Spirochaetes bacterium]|nr:tetratricopeptide repeat protein [Spirochaetota bacterium]